MKRLVAVSYLLTLALNVQISWGKKCGYGCSQKYKTLCANPLKGFSCSKTRQVTCYKCCSGWTGSLSRSCPDPICWGEVDSCPNGGRCDSPDNCINCNQGYYSPRCDRCTSISNCNSVTCSTSSDQTCLECDGDFGIHGAAYKPSSNARQCIKQCSWRKDSHACYPGSCNDVTSCDCSSGFSGDDCRTLSSSQNPVLNEHRGTLIQGTTQLESPQGSSATVYTNKADFERLRVSWKSSYQPRLRNPTPSSPPHEYIHSFGLGIVASSVSARVNLARGGTYQIFSTRSCSAGSQNSPRTDLVDCEYESNINPNSWTPQTGDILRYEVQTTNGGFLKLNNRDYGSLISVLSFRRDEDEFYTRYYNGRTVSDSATFTFDFVEPYHCVDVSCRASMLSAGDDVTTQGSVSVTWRDWRDDLAGVKEYELQVRQLSGLHGSQMTEIFDSSVYFDVTNSGQRITFPDIGVYSFVLTTVDSAGNFRLSRRFVFFDDDPNDVTITDDGPLRVTSATPGTDYLWITALNEDGGRTPVHIVWQSHFTNLRHLNQGLLKPIGTYTSTTILSDYDQNFGVRGRAGIPHALGVTEFRVKHDFDRQGGRDSVQVTDNDSRNWINEGINTQSTYDLDLVDGLSVRSWVEARDIAGHFIRDNVLVHVDSSPPIIENFWLERDGEVNLAVHNAIDLHDMSVVFRTFDIHSGLRQIEWRLFSNNTGSDVEHGRQTVPPRTIDTTTQPCEAGSCICVPVGDCYAADYGFKPTFFIGAHDYDYFITLTVTNNARLVTIKTIKVTVDISPPQAGVVQDGLRGFNELDYVSGRELIAYWDGFFDKESGVKFYQYLFDDTCWNATLLIGTVRDYMSRTTSTNGAWYAPSPGLYFVTVIAYNHALEPSEPVCSDGIVVDASPPLLSDIGMSNSQMLPGLAVQIDDSILWYIDEYRSRVELTDASRICWSKATAVRDISIYPKMAATNVSTSDILQGDLDCDWIRGIQEKHFLPAHKHVNITWIGVDKESSIYDFEIGLSSDPSNPTPDLVTFMSSSGHNHFVMYHPHFSQGSMFYLVVKAVNKAQLSTTKVVGPILVDTTPPTFVGSVSVHSGEGYLIAEWADASFLEDVATDLRYHVGIGSSSSGTETLAFQPERVYKTGPCSAQSSCAAFSLDSLNWYLHGDHEYYVSVRAMNGAGLTCIGTSAVYRHVVQLPSQGVVLDVAPPGEEVDIGLGVAKDIDVQTNTSTISARWFGFEHPHLDINYEIAVGSKGPNTSDVTGGFEHVGNVMSYQLDNLELTPLMTYYVTIVARSDTGSVLVSSDGVRVIPEGQVLEGGIVKDGLGCDSEQVSPPGLSHHSSPPSQLCEDDTNYQSSTSDISVRWTIPEPLQPYVTNVFWAVEQELETNPDDEGDTMQWITLVDYQDLGMAFQHVASGLSFQAGGHYRSKVRFCHVDVCFEPMMTDGFWVLSIPPDVGAVTITELEKDKDRITYVSFKFQPFVHDYVRHGYQEDLMDFYELSITEDGTDGAVLSQWTRLGDLFLAGEMFQFKASFSGYLDHDSCLRLSIRGYNKAGLSSIAATQIVDCEDVTLVSPHIVIDAANYVTLLQNAAWTKPDKNYVTSTDSLSAVWPTLRHRYYQWSAIVDTGSTEYGDLDQGLRYPCDHPRAINCGQTEKEYVNVMGLSLEHGKRYRICIHADEKIVEHEVWTETLPSVSSCSDGVVVDTTPPIPGSLWIGWTQHQKYQSSRSELVLHWESFRDVEEHGMTQHTYGIKYYEYAIGSMRGGADVREYTRVGVANNVIAHNLPLQSGNIYYATLRGTDFVGLSAVIMSDSITIDMTPPAVSASFTLDIGASFILCTTSITASWRNVFYDDESGIAFYEWAVGSGPGHGDIMPFTRVHKDSGVTDPSRPLTLQEGHSYYVSVKAINLLGLTTLKSFGAFRVDASPPIAGHVFDGNPVTASDNQRDQDFQDDRTYLGAFWEGFHDPHSAIIGYTWWAGQCKMCGDVIAEQKVGLDTYAFANHLNLVPGMTYYVTVKACNAADLCTTVTSDGVMVDDSPPVAGHVFDGSPSNGDISFQSSSLQVSAHWWGFHDPHSGLSHYEWRAGTMPGSEDILAMTRIELSEDALTFLPDTNHIPEGIKVYITVRVYNWLGMWAEATSNGFQVDSSPPVVVKATIVDKMMGSMIVNTQVLCDVLHFSWQFVDSESGIKDQYVSLHTNHNGDINIIPFKISGSEIDHSFTNMSLHEGSQYVITVVACNFAGRCTESKADSLLVDCSPSSIGTFAVGTESAANLQRHKIVWLTPDESDTDNSTSSHSGWMTWLQDSSTSQSSLALAWLGFADVHSGVDYYLISVGSSYGGNELTPNGPVRVAHSSDGMSLDEGIAQTTIIPLEGAITNLTYPYLYVSIWAVNGVGIPSGRHHSAFEASSSSSSQGPLEGALVLLRRCSPTTCEGHCACAPLDRVCTSTTGTCNDVTNENPNTEVEIVDILELTFDDIDAVIDSDHTITQYMMAAVWRISESKGKYITWYEWSLGDDSSPSQPLGVFDSATERVWYDVGQDNSIIVTLEKDRKLSAGVKYHVFLRAWYDRNTYAIFKSDGIIPDITHPKISKIKGTKVKDLARADSSKDIDYMTTTDAIYISWPRLFLDSAMSHYQVSLSTYPGGEDIHRFENNTLSANETRTEFTDLDLLSSYRYYSNVRAFNKAGLHTLRSSDGFVIDTRQPDTGLVLDGIGFHDVEYQNSSVLISASWHGFVDLESYINGYEWCVGQSQAPADDGILACMDVGMTLSSSKMTQMALDEGIHYFSKITAIDAAGLRSESVSSDGFVVDTSPPVPLDHIHLGDNLLKNPSFEELSIPPPDIDIIDEIEATTVSVENMTSEINTTATPINGTSQANNESVSMATDSINANVSNMNLTTPTILPTTEMPSSVNITPTLVPVPWRLGDESQFDVVTSGRKFSKDGDSFLSLYGSISQMFDTQLGRHYLVIVFASHVVPSHDPLLNQEGRIEAPGLNRIFKLYDRLAEAHSDTSLKSIKWHEHRFYFTADEDVSKLTLTSVGRSNGILLDNVQVREVTTEMSSGDGSIQVHTQFIHSWSSIQANWHFIDAESPIVEYRWAIGTVQGGSQLQSFTSIGLQNNAINTDLNVPHGCYVHISVTATNAADLITMATSNPVLIDLTPPVIDYVIDGDNEQDIQFSPDDHSLSFSWSVMDPESGIEHCEWEIGSEPGLDDIAPNTPTMDKATRQTVDLSQAMVEGQRLYVTIICYNYAEQSSWKSSDGVTILTEPPSISSAVINVYTKSESQYEARSGYQSLTDKLRGSWDGFTDPFGINFYECHLSSPLVISPWRWCGAASQTHLDWSELSLKNGVTYSLAVRAVNHAGLSSQAISHNFTVETSPPTSRANSVTWSWLGKGEVDLSWPAAFSSTSSLIYEVSLGSLPGGSDIIQWVETMETGMRVSPLAPSTDYYLTLAAINGAGLAKTLTVLINDA